MLDVAAPPRTAARIGKSFRFGVPRPLEFFGDTAYARLFDQALERLGGDRVEIDYAPFQAAQELLYDGPWLAERTAQLQQFIEQHADDMHPVTRQVTIATLDASPQEFPRPDERFFGQPYRYIFAMALPTDPDAQFVGATKLAIEAPAIILMPPTVAHGLAGVLKL